MTTESTNMTSDMELLARDFAFHCIRLRKHLGLTQDKFAKLMGLGSRIGKITISRWESGRHKPQLRYLHKFIDLQIKYDSERKTSDVRIA